MAKLKKYCENFQGNKVAKLKEFVNEYFHCNKVSKLKKSCEYL